jgi:DNA adenine methylase
MVNLVSPFRYPGSKSALIDYFAEFLDANGFERPHLYEPYAGGASIALGMLGRNLVEHATIVERDPLVYAFWRCTKERPAILCDRIRTLDVSVRTWRRYQKFLVRDALKRFDLLDLGVAGIFLNRTNFSGIIGAKPIGGMLQNSDYAIDCRFNKDTIIAKICRLYKVRDRLTVKYGDAISFLTRNQDMIKSLAAKRKAVVYIDPPYYEQGCKLYRFHYRDAEHRRLAAHLNRCGLPWLISYDNNAFIRSLFEGQRIVPISLQYTVKASRHVDELLITNQRYLPRPHRNAKRSERRCQPPPRHVLRFSSAQQPQQTRAKACGG